MLEAILKAIQDYDFSKHFDGDAIEINDGNLEIYEDDLFLIELDLRMNCTGEWESQDNGAYAKPTSEFTFTNKEIDLKRIIIYVEDEFEELVINVEDNDKIQEAIWNSISEL